MSAHNMSWYDSDLSSRTILHFMIFMSEFRQTGADLDQSVAATCHCDNETC